jgi:hypothetical protein
MQPDRGQQLLIERFPRPDEPGPNVRDNRSGCVRLTIATADGGELVW